MTFQEPIHDVAQLAMVEIFTPKYEESLNFFETFLGMYKQAEDGKSAYLRAYEDRYHHSMKLTRSDKAGVGVISWRAMSPQALERRVAAIAASGQPGRWVEGHKGYGRAYEFTTPDGHVNHLFWDVEYFKPTEAQRSRLLSRAQKRPLSGVPVRRLDHVNIMVSDVTKNATFMQETLGFQKRENVVFGGKDELACWLSVSPLVHEIAMTKDNSGHGNRLHHLAFWYGSQGQMLDIADLLKEYGLHIEAGPAKHGISQGYFIYFYEPGGNRIELFGDCGYLIFDPEWKTVTWDETNFWSEGGVWIGGDLPQDFFVYGTPIVEAAAEAARAAEVEPAE
ncbi:VOC family protein [Pseudogemmobacter humi]|uniref:Manganese-dependent 2,3-dihydroxybiphenyl 1,2-dioxygenase n=1 Tax=Pseudogemmobacter humi TaxID=2483812 RepID=A0A3P5X476_9RHOB|nr:VOC family protein [Pseudogemmobacter humi]VDC29350.1 Manganese-dependent 2,3-dihydroxybiphenyl 1,2-dioxygenase [Pseudogemmobacter humi]